MAAVAPGTFPHSAGFYRPESMAEHRPSFTAVNEPSHNPSESNGAQNARPAGPERPERTEIAPPTTPIHERASVDLSMSKTAERREEGTAEHKSIPAPPSSVGPSAPTPNAGLAPIIPPPHSPISQRSEGNEARRPSILNDVVNSGSVRPSVSEAMSSHKRKRSISPNTDRHNHPPHNQSSPPRSPKSSNVAQATAGTIDEESISPRQPYPPPSKYQHTQPTKSFSPPPASRHAYPAPPEQPAQQAEAYPRTNGVSRNEYEPPLDPSIAGSQERPYFTESRLAEALQRENRSYDPAPARDDYAAAEEQGEEQEQQQEDQQQQFGTYGGSREAGTADIDRKRRKRIFSNRTKTGCMTCRRRKKKCDETHPECNNCLRGGFVCEGYSVRTSWQKPANAKQPVPLQSKNGFPPQEGTPTRAPYPAMSRYQDSVSDYSRHSSISGPQPPYDPKRDSVSEHDNVYGKTSPPSQQKTQPSWTKNAASHPYPSHPPDASKYRGGEHRGSIYEITQERDEGGPMRAPQVHRNASVSAPYSHSAISNNPNTSPPQRTVQAQAQAALEQVHPRARQPHTDREKMLTGQDFFSQTPALIEDRERCIAAVWRFNNATNPSNGISPEERARLFRQILAIKPSPEPPLSTGETPSMSIPLPVGRCGERLIVEAPFHCDYGYNIEIGDDVLIGADCRISDYCQVKIGNRCIFGPGVKLICTTYPIDPRRRCGSGGKLLARSIIIEDDCWIGAGSTLTAGVKVGKCSTVAAGSLVHNNIPPCVVAAGNPAIISRGIYDDPRERQPHGERLA